MNHRPPRTPRLPRRRTPILAAAVLAVALPAVAASGQTSANQSGGAIDANPQVGSGGRNAYGGYGGASGAYGGYEDPYGAYTGGYGGYGSYGNNLVTGNVTGGRQFRGDVGYTDPRSFRGAVGGSEFDAFNRGASGVTAGGQVIDYAQSSRPYFGDQTVANPPDGFVRTPGTGGYVPPRVTGYTADLADLNQLRDRGEINAAARVEAGANGSRLSSLFAGGAADADPRALVAADDAAVDAAVDGRAAESLLRAGRRGEGEAGLAEAAGRPLSLYTRLGREDRLSDVDGRSLRSLTDELLRDDQGNPLTPEEIDGLLDGRASGGTRVEAGTTAGRAVDATVGGGLATTPELADIEAAARPAGDLTGEADDRVLRLADPAEQSAQYRQLRDRLERFEQDPLADRLRPSGVDRAAREADAARQAQDDAAGEAFGEGGGVEGGGGADAFDLPGLPRMPTVPDTTPAGAGDVRPLPPTAAGGAAGAAGGAAPQAEAGDPPVVIESFAAGVTSPSLKGLIDEAESLMAQGKYVSAVTRFNAAEYLVPNQPIVSLGQATAELGAGYYRRAADDLRRAFDQNPELTMARVDLVELLGRDRVAEIAEDLRGLAQKDPDAERPLFLLAFVSYGAGNYAQAATFLDLAERQNDDPFYAAVRKLWALDARAAAEDEDEPATRPAALEPMGK